MRGVAALDAIADDDVDRPGGRIVEAGEEAPHLGQVELQVAVGKRDEPTARAREARSQRATIAAVLLVDDADLGMGRRERVGELRRAIGRAVVDDDDLDRVHQRTDLGERPLDGALHVFLLVEGGKEEAELRPIGLARGAGWLRVQGSTSTMSV